MQVAQAGQEALDHRFIQLFGTHVAAQLSGDECQVLLLAAGLTGQRDNARILMKQAGAIELIEGRKQLAQG